MKSTLLKSVLLCGGMGVFVPLWGWEKTCDARELIGSCYEMSATFGTPAKCPAGHAVPGKCSRSDDLGLCKRGSDEFPLDNYFYAGTTSCAGTSSAEACHARLVSNCINFGEGVWVNADDT